MQMFKEIFNNQSDHGKSSFLRKLRGIIDPSKILIGEPSVKKNNRGRPKAKNVNHQTQFPHRHNCPDMNQRSPRQSSVFVDLNEESPRHSSVFVDLNEEPPRHSSFFMDLNEEPMGQCSYKLDLNQEAPVEHGSLWKEIPTIFHPYITRIQNVRGDGNCGFRSIAACLGHGEDKWLYVRQQLLNELLRSYDAYARVFTDGLDDLLTSLSFSESPAPLQHWMIMPITSILIANTFGVIIHFLSNAMSISCFPLWKGPEEFQQHQVLTISYVYDNHYVMVQLEGEYPMPPIMGLWIRHKNPSAAGWETMYKSRLKSYRKLKPAQKTFINLDDYC